MTSAETLLSDPQQPSVALCAILSVVVHFGLLAGLGFMPKPTPTIESVPVIQISLVPVQSKKPSVSAPQPPPSLRAVSRPVSAPVLSLPPPSQVMTSRLKSVDSTLKPPVTQPAQKPPPNSSNKKVVKDQQTADAIVGRTLTKLSTSRSTHTQGHTLAQPSPPASQLMTSPLKSVDSTLKPPVTQPAQEPPSNSSNKKVVKDQQAADALIGRSLMKLSTSRSSHTQGHTLVQPSSPVLSGANNAATPSSLVDPSASSKEVQAISSFSGQRRVLAAIPPSGQDISGSQVEIIHYVPPVHPRLAKELGWEGTVVVKFLVQTNGLPSKVTVKKSSGYPILDKAAKDAIQQWRFKPAKDGNISINKITFATLKFELQ